MKGLPFEYRKYAMAKTGADPDRRSSFDFCQLLRAVESRIIATENAKRMDVLPEEDPLNIQLIQELRQQRNKLDRRRKGRLLDPVRPGVHGAPTQQQSPSTDQEIDEMAAAQGPTQGCGLAPEYEDWQSRTQPPQDSRPPQDL